MSNLRLKTLGGVQVLINEQDITTELPIKIVALLVYLARQNQSKPREHLAELLWPDRTAKQAYGSLRTAISKARPFLGDALNVAHQSIGVDAWLDANQFEALLPTTIGDALKLYHGEFMASFFTNDAREFEDWQIREAESLHEKFIQAVIQHIPTIPPQEAILIARHALGLSPLREDLHRILIQLYHTSGDRAAALKQYQTCCSLMWEEFGLDPDPETKALAAQLEQATTIKAHYRLPTRMHSFIGRRDVLYNAEALIKSNALLTITATGGAGKTRLALELGYRLQDYFHDGVCFVDLSDLTHAEQVVPAITQALGISSDLDYKQMTPFLQNREMLLILDNFEHVLDAANVLAYWMEHVPALTILTTSREPLKLYGEQVFNLQALTLQEACQLFYERVRVIHPDFHRTEAADAEIREICQRLDGLPLAIELAATRARTMSFHEILQGLTHRLSLLKSDLRNLSHRQGALFHTIDWSYALLTPEQQTLFRWLAIFRGGWTQQAVNTISRYAHMLSDLVEKNLIRRAFFGTHRFTMLETLREYAYYQLEKSGELIAAQNAHAQWVLQLSETIMQDIRTTKHEETITRYDNEEENIRVALDYLAEQPDQIETYARIISALGWIWNLRQIAEVPFKHAQYAIQQAGHLPDTLQAHLLVAGGHSADALGYCDLAETWHRQALSIFEACGDELNANYVRFYFSGRMLDEDENQRQLFKLREKVFHTNDEYLLSMINLNLGTTLFHIGNTHDSQIILEEGMEICERNGFRLLIPLYCLNLSDTYNVVGNIKKAFNFLERSYAMTKADGNRFHEAYSLVQLCELCYAVGRMDDLYDYLQIGLQLLNEVHSPLLFVRFHFWRGVIASHHDDMPQLYAAFQKVFHYIAVESINMSSYIINTVLYLAYMLALHEEYADAALLISGADAYTDVTKTTYYSYQQIWRNQALNDTTPSVTSMNVERLIETAQQALEKLLDR